jgi:aminopeptidase N
MLNVKEKILKTDVIYRSEYQAPPFWIDTVHLTFDLDPLKTRVLNKMWLRRNLAVTAQPLRLNGEGLNLARILINGKGTTFKLENYSLIVNGLPENDEPFELEIFTTCVPIKNTTLMGLYVSNNSFFTQCEAEGFRRITYFVDRPDVMAKYKVTLRGDKLAYPVMLSNGNLIEQGELEQGRHYAVWEDPFRKPSYLFALVAGQLVAREQRIISRAGKEHLLQIYVRANDLDKTEHAMKSLMASVAWDESRFNLSLDLDRFMIVATSDFNMGAMENKGLNIFNSKFVLANPAVATDSDFLNVERVVGHEYFHNWTGNRITCRDWFQLSLKEGLTVFRDHEFTKDMCQSDSARAVVRINEVRDLRTAQFSEDAGPMAHSVRPDSYSEIDNFYTATVYEKGSEVIRMMNILVGRDGFAKGMALYFERFDGQAVTCDDFAQAIADANQQSELTKHLTQFKRWYSQAGTPVVTVSDCYDEQKKTYTLTLIQSYSNSPGQSEKLPFLMPIKIGLMGATDKKEMTLIRVDECTAPDLLVLTEKETNIVFTNVNETPIPSFLRGFSAPIVLEYTYSKPQLLYIFEHDTDEFCRWEAGQLLAMQYIMTDLVAAEDTSIDLDQQYLNVLRATLRDPNLDAAFKEVALILPSENYIAEKLSSIDPQRIHAIRQTMSKAIAVALHEDWEWVFETHQDTGNYSPDSHSSGRRALTGMALRNLCLAAMENGSSIWPGKTLRRVQKASNMTDRMNAISALVHSGHALASKALDILYDRFKDEALVIDKWFALQVGKSDCHGDVLSQAEILVKHGDFSISNPNRTRSVLSTYCNNPAAFHRKDGAGYVFWAHWVMKMDESNPQVAARLARTLERWNKLTPIYREQALAAIERVHEKENLSTNTREVIVRALSMKTANFL